MTNAPPGSKAAIDWTWQDPLPRGWEWRGRGTSVIIAGLPSRPNPLEGNDMFEWKGRLRVLGSCHVEADGRRWVHLSISDMRSGAMPTWANLERTRTAILGPRAKAVQVIPPKSEHYTFPLGGPDVAHIWHCLDGDPLPDFRYPGGGV